MPMNPRLLRPLASGSGSFLLDKFGGAAVAYGLRRLRKGYTGPAVQVRRSNDNAEANFTPEEVSNGTLAAWVGSGNDGFVKTWYDQSTGGANASRTDAGTQPRIVNSGSLETLNGKPALNFISGRLLTFSRAFSQSSFDIFAAIKVPAAGSVVMFGWDSLSDAACFPHITVSPNTGVRVFWRNVATIQEAASGNIANLNAIYALSYSAASATLAMRRNSQSVASGATTTPAHSNANGVIGANGAGLSPWNGIMSELVLFTPAPSGAVDLIENNMNQHFGFF